MPLAPPVMAKTLPFRAMFPSMTIGGGGSDAVAACGDFWTIWGF
jgi:hypothetical protein